jgi:hypothetical protein
VGGQLLALAVLFPGKEPWYPLDMRLDGHQSLSGLHGEEKSSQPLLKLEPLIIQPVAQRYTTELSRLQIRWKSNYKFLVFTVFFVLLSIQM